MMLSSKTEEKVVRCAMTIVGRYVVSESEDAENFICRWKVNSLEIEDKDGHKEQNERRSRSKLYKGISYTFKYFVS